MTPGFDIDPSTAGLVSVPIGRAARIECGQDCRRQAWPDEDRQLWRFAASTASYLGWHCMLSRRRWCRAAETRRAGEGLRWPVRRRSSRETANGGQGGNDDAHLEMSRNVPAAHRGQAFLEATKVAPGPRPDL